MALSLLHQLRILSRHLLPWLIGAVSLSLNAASPVNITIGTGELNGVYYPTGGAICRLLNQESARHGLHCMVKSTEGSLDNLNKLAKGEIQLALVQSDVLSHGAHGTGPFAGHLPDNRVRSLFQLHQEPLSLIVSATSDISTLTDILGKRVDLGSPNSGDRVTSQALLDAMGWQEQDFAASRSITLGNRLEGLCNGGLDAAFVVAGHPNQGIGDLTGRCNARLIAIEGEQIDQLLKHNHQYRPSHIDASLYPAQAIDINTFAVTAELVALASLPPDQVRTVRDVLTTHLKQFTRLHPALARLTLTQMQAETDIPPHPGMLDAIAPPPDEPPSLTATPAQIAVSAAIAPAASSAANNL